MELDFTDRYSNTVDEIIRRNLLSSAGVYNNVEYGNGRSVRTSLEIKIWNGNNFEVTNGSYIMDMSQQKHFTFAVPDVSGIDYPERAREFNNALRRQIEQVIVPAIDTYRFSRMAEKAGTKVYLTPSKSAYYTFMCANEIMGAKHIDTEGRIAFCTNDFIERIRHAENFISLIDIEYVDTVYKGMVGTYCGVPVIAVPKRRMPEGAAFIITHPSYAIAPVKLHSYKIIHDPPGITGTLVEGIIYYDLFVLEENNKGIAVCFDRATGLVDLLTRKNEP